MIGKAILHYKIRIHPNIATIHAIDLAKVENLRKVASPTATSSPLTL